MSRLADLLKQKPKPANSAISANQVGTISSTSKISKGITQSSKLTADFERRVRAMAIRWNYTDADLREMLAADPAKLLLAVVADEKRSDEERRLWMGAA